MNQFTIKQTIALLAKVYNYTIQVFYYFPDVIIVGKQKIEREEFLYLCSEGFIYEFKADSFGKFYKLSAKAEKFIYYTVSKSAATKRKVKMTIHQPRLELV